MSVGIARRTEVYGEPVEVVAKALKVAQNSQFAARLGDPRSVEIQGKQLESGSRRMVNLRSGDRSVPPSDFSSPLGRTNRALELVQYSREGLKEMGFNVMPRALDAGLVFVGRPSQNLRERMAEVPGTDIAKEGQQPKISLAYVSGAAIEALSRWMEGDAVRSKGIDLPVLNRVHQLAEDRERDQKGLKTRGISTIDHDAMVWVLDFHPEAAKGLKRYASLQRWAEIYANRM